MKLAIGTVQFGVNYGINNSRGIPSDSDLIRIFDLASENSIEFLDTSIAYGNSEKRIAELSGNKFRIITKSSEVKSHDELKNSIDLSLLNLNTDHVYGYLFHNPKNLIDNPRLWSTLVDFKQNNKIQKIGYSLYETEQLEELLRVECIPDIVQLPYSLLDRKFERYFKKLKEMGCEIHVRSVFMQGLYFIDLKSLPQRLYPLRKYLVRLDKICSDYDLTIGDLALNFVNDNVFVDKVIVGIDSPRQLLENVDSLKRWNADIVLNNLIDEIDVIEKYLLNPMNWKN